MHTLTAYAIGLGGFLLISGGSILFVWSLCRIASAYDRATDLDYAGALRGDPE